MALVFRAQEGGVQRVNVDLANLLQEQGIEVSVVMPEAAGPYLEELREEVAVVSLGTQSHIGFALRLASYLRSNDCDGGMCLLVSQHHVGALAVLARRIASSPSRLVIVVHNHLSTILSRSALGFLLGWTLRWAYARADGFVCVSEGVACDLRRYLPETGKDVRVIYNPVLIDRLEYLATTATRDEPWLEPKQCPVFVAVGRLTRQKDYRTLLKAMALVAVRIPARLIIVGDGEERAALLDLARRLGIAERVRIVGGCTNPYSLMYRADALVVSSAWEGFGLTIVEALGLGVPVVSTDCESGPREILENGTYGRLVPVGDASALASAMEEVSRERRETEPGRRRAAFFSGERCLRSYLEVLGNEAVGK